MFRKSIVLLAIFLAVCAGFGPTEVSNLQHTALPPQTFAPAFTPTVTFTPPPTITPLPIPTKIPLAYPYVEDIQMDPACSYSLTNEYTGESAILSFLEYQKQEAVPIIGKRTLRSQASIQYQLSSGESGTINVKCEVNIDMACAHEELIEFDSTADFVVGYSWKPQGETNSNYMYGQNGDIYLTIPVGWIVTKRC